jgi:hypothetical protein
MSRVRPTIRELMQRLIPLKVLSSNILASLHFWQYFLRKIERVQKGLQYHTMNSKDAALNIESLDKKVIADLIADKEYY